jgi:ATPase subunit of ABC transporter with duplicated ATPase domains
MVRLHCQTMEDAADTNRMKVRDIGSFCLERRRCREKVKVFSGGERNRLAL